MSPFPWLALNLSTVYLVLGIFSPFWGVWLESVGLTSEEIGLLLGLGYGMRVAGNLAILKNVKRAELLIPVTRILIWSGPALFYRVLFISSVLARIIFYAAGKFYLSDLATSD